MNALVRRPKISEKKIDVLAFVFGVDCEKIYQVTYS